MRKPSNTCDGKKKGSPKGKRKLQYPEKKEKEKLPLVGKAIYLDVKDVRQSKQIETDLRRLGASVEEFLIKDINYVITSQPRPKGQKADDKIGSADSPAALSTPSPFNCGPSPGTTDKKAPAATVTRGKAILQKAQLTKKTSSVIENAEKWGVKIIPLEAALKYIQKEIAKLPKVSQKNEGTRTTGGATKIKRLKQPLLKFESNTNQYKPIYSQLESWPHPNVETPKGTCPFDGTTVGRGERSQEERGDRIGLVHADIDSPGTPTLEGEQNNSATAVKGEVQSKSKPSDNSGILGGVRIVTAGEIRRRKELKRLAEKKRGYCECCMVKYENLDKHVNEEQHRTYIRDKKNYEALDHMIKTGPNTALFLQRVLMKHCVNKRTEPSELEDNASESADKSNSETVPSSHTPSQRLTRSPRKTKNSIQLPRCLVKVDRQLGLESPKFTASVSKKVLNKEMNQQPESSKIVNKDVKEKNERMKISTSVSKDVDKEQRESVSPTEKACAVGDNRSSDGLDMVNHVIPKRTKNTYGMYLHMSPSRVSWKKIMKIGSEPLSEEPLQEHSVDAEIDDACQEPGSIEREKTAEEKDNESENISEDRGHKTVKRPLRHNIKEISSQKDVSPKAPEHKIPTLDDKVVTVKEKLSQPRRSLRQTNKTEICMEGSHDEVDGDSTNLIPIVTKTTSKSGSVLTESPRRHIKRSTNNLSQKQEKPSVTEDNYCGKQNDQNHVKDGESNFKSAKVNNNVDSTVSTCLDIKNLSPSQRRTSSRLHPVCENTDNANLDETSTANKRENSGKETSTYCERRSLSLRNPRVSKQHSAVDNDADDKSKSRGVVQITNDKSHVEKDVTDSKICQTMSPRKLRDSSKKFCEVEKISRNVNTRHSANKSLSDSNQHAAVNENDFVKPCSLSPENQKVSGNLSFAKESLINDNSKKDVIENVNNNNSNVLVNERENIVKIRTLSPRKLRVCRSQRSPNGVSDTTAMDKNNVDRNKKTRLSRSRVASVDFKDAEGSVENFSKDDKVVRTRKAMDATLKAANCPFLIASPECPDTLSTNIPPQIQKDDKVAEIPSPRSSHRKHKGKKGECEVRGTGINHSSVSEEKSVDQANDTSISTDVAEENRFFVNSMELVKQRSIMRRLQAQSQACSSSPSTVTPVPSNKPRKYFRKQGTPRRTITSPASTSKITEMKKARANKLIKISLNCSSTDSRLEARKKASVLHSKCVKQDRKVVRKSPAKLRTFSRLKQNLVQAETINSDPDLRVLRKRDTVKSYGEVSDPDILVLRRRDTVKSYQKDSETDLRVLRRRDTVKSYREDSETDLSEEMSCDDKSLSCRSISKFNQTASSSPAFNKSPRFRTRLVTITSRKDNSLSPSSEKLQRARRLLKLQTESNVCDLRKSGGNVVTENVDVYDINNELGNTPAKSKKGKKNHVKSPQSGYSSTPRSSKRKRQWRAKKESSSQASEKRKPIPKRLSRFKTEVDRNSDDVHANLGTSSADSRISKHTNQTYSDSTVRQECAHKQCNSRAGQGNCSFAIGKRKSGARVKLDLSDGKDDEQENHSRNMYDNDKFVAIKKLEISDLTILTDDCDYTPSGKERVHGKGTKSDISTTKSVPARKLVQENEASVGRNLKSPGNNTNNLQNRSFTLQWHSVMPVPSSETDQKNSSKTVKLDKSWSLLTDRSVAKILESEGESESFEGFKPDDLRKESLLGSDISFVEANEVDMSDNSVQEWEVEQDQPESDIIDYVADACTFTSPGKRTDSSWDDPFDNYIDTQLQMNTSDSKPKFSPQKALTSPHRNRSRLGKESFPGGQKTSDGGNSGTPRKRKLSGKNPSCQGSKDKLQSTPKRQKISKSSVRDSGIDEVGVQRIDDDIIFNYCSPQKMQGFRSPARSPEGEVVESSSPLKGGCLTSTPFTLCTRQKSQEAHDVMEELPALNSPVHVSSMQSSEIKDRRILKKVSTVKKRFSLPHNKREKSRSRDQTSNINSPLMSGVEIIMVSPKR